MPIDRITHDADGNPLDMEFSSQDIGMMIIEGIADSMREKYEGMDLPEIAALHKIVLIYEAPEDTKSVRAESDAKRYIMIDPKLRKVEREKHFYLMLATFVYEDEFGATEE